MERCVLEEGVPSFKVYLAYKDTVGIDDRDLVRVMAEVRRLGATLLVHAEHGEIIDLLRERMALAGQCAPRYHALSRPPVTEAEATVRVAMMAGLTGATTYVVHVTCAEAAAAIAQAQERGAEIYGETCPQYLLLDDTVYDAGLSVPRGRRRFAPGPPGAVKALGRHAQVGVDRVPTGSRKRQGTTTSGGFGGAAGVEHRLSLLWTFGVGSKEDRRPPVRRSGLGPSGEALRFTRARAMSWSSADADLPYLGTCGHDDPLGRLHHRHRCDLSIFEGLEESKGMPKASSRLGRLRFYHGECVPSPAPKRFLFSAFRTSFR
jgi:dihydropyrimidinase